jgi:transcriptional regulator with XRE-family HTH domain
LKTVGGGLTLSRSLRAIRRKRDLSAQDVAAAMSMAYRTYEEFEGGRGPQTIDRIFAFAEATDCDPYALILGPIFNLPNFALDCADTKLCLIMMMHLRDFADNEGPDIAYLEPPHLIGGFARVFKEFRGTLEEGDRFLQNWLDGRTGFVGLKTLRLRGAVRKPRKD